MERDRPIGVAVLALSEEAPGQLVADRLGEAGMRVVERAVCADAEGPIRTRVDRWIADPTVDVIVVIGGSELSVEDATRDAVSDAVTRVVPGFGELVRWTSYDKLDTPAVLNRASAALCNATLLVVLPGSAALVALVLESVLLPQLDPNGAAPTLAMLLPRFAKKRMTAAKPKAPPPPPPGRTPAGGATASPPSKVVIEPRRSAESKPPEPAKPAAPEPAKLFEAAKPAETTASAIEPPTLVDEPAVPAATLFHSEPAYDLRSGSRRIGRIAIALAALAVVSVAVALVVVVAPWRREAASAPVATEAPKPARAIDAAQVAEVAPPDAAEVAAPPEPEPAAAEQAPPDAARAAVARAAPSPSPHTPSPPPSPSPSPSPPPPPSSDSPSDVPEALDQGMVRVGVAQVKPLISACGEKAHVKGTVKVHVEVGPAGKVESTAVRDTPDDALGSCVAAALGRAHFPRTQTGGTFTYPFVFGG